jgi:DNA-binding NtrC family response regulator
MQKSILVVDDNADIAKVIERSLEEHDYNIHCFHDSIKAIDYFKMNAYDIAAIITDIRIPGMSGLELVSRVKKINPDVKVFFVTAFDIDLIKPEVDSLNYDIIDIFQKPLSGNEISSTVIKHLKS